jgi:hypothetical protein
MVKASGTRKTAERARKRENTRNTTGKIINVYTLSGNATFGGKRTSADVAREFR